MKSFWSRRPLRMVAAASVLSLGALGLTAVSPAMADTDPPPSTPATVAADALPTWQINGVVWSQVTVGNTVYATGQFSAARPPGVAVGGAGEVPVGNLLAYDIRTGNRIAAFNHTLNAQGMVITKSPDGSRVYVGGDFTTVDGIARGHIAAFDTATGNLVTTFKPSINGQVRALAVSNTTVYAGGSFASASGVARARLAAFSTATGAISTTWTPAANDGYVWSMVLTPNGSKVVIGGQNRLLSGTVVNGMGAVDAATGAVRPWAASSTIINYNNGATTSLRTDGINIYGTGFAFGTGGQFEGTFVLDADTGAIKVLNDCHGDTYDVLPMGNIMYSVSHVHGCDYTGAWPSSNPWSINQHHSMAQTIYPAGVNTGPDDYGWNYAGLPASGVLHWWPDFIWGNYTTNPQAGWSLTGNTEYIAVGGEFRGVNGGSAQGLTRFAMRPQSTNKQGPRAAAGALAPAARSVTAGSARLAWEAPVDRDNQTLSYEVYRSGTAAPIYTTSGASTFWSRPSMGYNDRGLAPGSTYTYTIRVKDSLGNLLNMVTNPVTITSTVLSSYGQSVLDDGASHYWRLGEPSGTSVLDSAGFDDMTATATVGRGAAGAIQGDSDLASTFNGSNAFAATQTPVAGPNAFSEEAWFKTTSRTGGRIVGFGSAKTGTSNNYDRHTYMDTSGIVSFGVWNNAMYTVKSPAPLNDGQWHHVVGTMDPSGVTLFVDGKLIGRNSGTSFAQAYNGYWRIGGDSTWAGNPYFNGTIDDVALYPTALTLAQVQTHYANSGRGTLPANALPTASYTVTSAGLKASFDGSGSTDADGTVASYAWDFGDGGTAAVVAPTHTFATAGTYTVKLTVTDNRGGTNTKTDTVTVTNTPPVAAFTSTSNALVASFDGSGSTDADGTVASYAWDFGDGGTAAVVSPDHTYANPGTYDVALTVTDSAGGTATVTHAITVSRANVAPTAAFTSTSTGLAAALDGSGSADPDGTVASYAWAFGDGSPAGSGVTPTHAYAAAGTYAVVLTVTDNDGATASVSHPVTVTAPANQLPTASFTATSTDLSASFDGTASSDPDGSIASYAWNFGDTTPAGSGSKPVHAYATAGTYQVTLTVTDNRGGTNAVTKPVTVSAPPVNTPIAADQFGRTTANAWGTADTGGPWTVGGSSAQYSVTGGEGVMSMAAGGGPTAYLSGVASTDSDLSVAVTLDKLPSAGSVYLSVVARGTARDGYLVKTQISTVGKLTEYLIRSTAGVETVLGSRGLTDVYAPGNVLMVRVVATGVSPTALRAKVWKQSAAEPAAWQLTASDSTAALQVARGVGLAGYLSGLATNAPAVFRFDGFQVVRSA